MCPRRKANDVKTRVRSALGRSSPCVAPQYGLARATSRLPARTALTAAGTRQNAYIWVCERPDRASHARCQHKPKMQIELTGGARVRIRGGARALGRGWRWGRG
eukprot:6210304-Pleurochrysis_carterae.AAC.1